MQQVGKFHKNRIEYRTVNLVYWNNYSDATVTQQPDLFKLNTIFPGEAMQETFITRQFDLALGDKNPIKVRIFNFSFQTPFFNNENNGDNENIVSINTGYVSNNFNQIILFNCELFQPYGPIPISLNTSSNISFKTDDNSLHNYVYGADTLNSLDFIYTPTQQVKSLNNVTFQPSNPYGLMEANITGQLAPTLYLPVLMDDGHIMQKTFTLSFIVELEFDN